MSEPGGERVCRTYTSARRHPKVIGVIGGHRMPFPSTNTQLLVFIVSAIVLLKTRAWWGIVMPVTVQFILCVGLPCLGWWAVRYWNPEGRAPFRAAVGAINYAFRPRRGSIEGRGLSQRTTSVVGGGGCFYLAGDDDGA